MAAFSAQHPEVAAHFSTASSFLSNHLYAVSAFLIFLYFLHNKFTHGLYSIPGPFLASVTDLWRLVSVYHAHHHETLVALHKKHGLLVRIAPNVVSIGDPAAIQMIYGIKSNFIKTGFYPLWGIPWERKNHHGLFSAVDPAYHRDQKKLVAGSYSMSSVLELEAQVDSCSRLFMEQLGRFADQDKVVNLGEWLQFYAFDVVGELSFSKKFGFLESGKDIDLMIHQLQKVLPLLTLTGQVPYTRYLYLNNPLIPLLFPKMHQQSGVVDFTVKAIKARDGFFDEKGTVKTAAVGKDMLSKWTTVMEETSGKMTTLDIMIQLVTLVFAGSDTTAIALRAIIYFLLKNPAKLDKLVAELDNAEASRLLSEPVSYKESTTHLPYLNACIKEAIRMHPSVGLILERRVPKGGAQIAGHFFPEGTTVGINAWVIHNDPTIFPSPETFAPERWLEASPSKLQEMNQCWFPFGAGTRSCIGKNISMMEMSKVVPQLFREYKVSLATPDLEWEVRNYWFVQQENLFVKVERRRGV
ncbi:putative cytochrome P450 [Myxozyma melibiosi]|uniref:Cytochrome P450 n=1 Tax=Myxozyma melibiosi TaxID=54550 RepID=A0ABR1F3G5_9ASCO